MMTQVSVQVDRIAGTNDYGVWIFGYNAKIPTKSKEWSRNFGFYLQSDGDWKEQSPGRECPPTFVLPSNEDALLFIEAIKKAAIDPDWDWDSTPDPSWREVHALREEIKKKATSR